MTMPIYGPIPEKLTSDPNGVPGQTSGNVPVTDSSTLMKGANEPTAGSPPGQPASPRINPLDETFGPPPSVTGPGEG